MGALLLARLGPRFPMAVHPGSTEGVLCPFAERNCQCCWAVTASAHRSPSCGSGRVLGWLEQLREMVQLIGRLLLDAIDLVRHPRRWPAREISAGVYRAGAQAMGILALVGFLIGVVLSYLCGDQLRRFGAEMYVVNLLGLACVRELGPLLAAILVAGRSGSSITAQLGVMRLNEELDALTTIGVPYTQRLILAKVIALAISQPLVGLWTSAIALIGGMVAAHVSLRYYYYFLTQCPERCRLRITGSARARAWYSG
jgi:phospholipid/cholesterol/gamma-HCH transport system permease protein